VPEGFDVAVVGGGLTGLAAAALLATARRRVVLLESRGSLGGRALSTMHLGYHVNLGPRALYRGPTRSLLRRLGVAVPGGRPPTAGALALYEGRLHRGFMTVPGLLTSPLLGRRDRALIAKLLATLRGAPSLAAQSTGDWLDARLPTARSRLAVSALARIATYAGDPASVSADAVAQQLAAARLGVSYVDGGWRTLVTGLSARAADAGALLRPGARVTAVQPERDGYLVMVDRSPPLRAGVVVLAGLSPASAGRLLGIGLFDAGALRAACLDVTLRRLPDPHRTFIYGLDEPVYLAVHSLGARLAPDGGAVVHLVRYDDGHDGRPAATRARLEALLDEHQPGWRELLVRARFAPRLVVANGVPRPGAGLRGRPDHRVAGRPGVFLAGDWVGPTGLLADAATASAGRAVRAALDHLAARS
jgi:phytoene dehydrogenase-like protein